MRKLLATLVGLLILGIVGFFAWTALKAGDDINFAAAKLQDGAEIKVDSSKGEFLYEVASGEAVVKDLLIDRILVGSNVSVSYRNTTQESLRPIYTISLYNSYGLLIGEESVSSKDLEPGEVGAETINFTRFPVQDILKHSNISGGDDLDQIQWIVISDTTTKVATD